MPDFDAMLRARNGKTGVKIIPWAAEEASALLAAIQAAHRWLDMGGKDTVRPAEAAFDEAWLKRDMGGLKAATGQWFALAGLALEDFVLPVLNELEQHWCDGLDVLLPRTELASGHQEQQPEPTHETQAAMFAEPDVGKQLWKSIFGGRP